MILNATKHKSQRSFREALHKDHLNRVVMFCACLDRNPYHCALIRDALFSGDDCVRARRCECGCHREAA